MRGSCSSDLLDDFDDFNDKIFDSSSRNSLPLINYIQNNDLPFFDEYSTKDYFLNENNSNKIIEYDPQLANLISNELGLNDSQTSRKNAWGNLSYAELITKAILNSYQQRLTLAQIYSWIILYVPYFKDKSDQKTSQGWKNSIRHNLSLHNRFVRIQNEISGKSSWWTIDLRAKQIRRRKTNQSNENKRFKKCEKCFTSVRDINQSFYSNLQNQSDLLIPNILHDMLKSSPLQTSISENDNINSTIISQSSFILNENEDNDQIISFKLKTMEKSNPLFRRKVFKLMRHQMNKNQLNIQREKVLSTPPPPSLVSPTDQLFQFNQNSNLGLDFQTISNFEQTTFHHSDFHIHDLPNL